MRLLISIGKFAVKGAAWLAMLIMMAWAFGALHFDLPAWNAPVSWAFLVVMMAVLILVRPLLKKIATCALLFAVVLGWWLTLEPRNDRAWLPSVAEVAWAEIKGDEITLHNVRNFDQKSGSRDPAPRWETRTVNLAKLTGVDIFINQWGSPIMAHPLVSFQFADAAPVCFSIETRKEKGEGYSALGGIYRQFELIYIVADERDVIRLRTNLRGGETTRLYRTTLDVAAARERFLEYVHSLNALKNHPRWYNAITANCTTSVRAQHPSQMRAKWDWRILANGSLDELMYQKGMIRSGGLPFSELRDKALINAAAQAAELDPDFSQRIREGRPGFGKP